MATHARRAGAAHSRPVARLLRERRPGHSLPDRAVPSAMHSFSPAAASPRASTARSDAPSAARSTMRAGISRSMCSNFTPTMLTSNPSRKPPGSPRRIGFHSAANPALASRSRRGTTRAAVASSAGASPARAAAAMPASRARRSSLYQTFRRPARSPTVSLSAHSCASASRPSPATGRRTPLSQSGPATGISFAWGRPSPGLLISLATSHRRYWTSPRQSASSASHPRTGQPVQLRRAQSPSSSSRFRPRTRRCHRPRRSGPRNLRSKGSFRSSPRSHGMGGGLFPRLG